MFSLVREQDENLFPKIENASIKVTWQLIRKYFVPQWGIFRQG